MPFRTPAQAGPLPRLLLQWLLLAGLLAGPAGAAAQGRAAVRGTVAGPDGAPVELATLTLHRAADSAVVKTEFSDAQGAFRLEAAAGRTYRVSAAQVGFGRYWSAAFELPPAGLVLPTIRLLTSAATALKEVTVTARRPLYERRADRTVVNVADSPLSAGASALDVLARSPGVSLDAGDNLGLRGRQGLLVVIDGKRVPLTGAELADYLKALPAEQLQSIELITNPPAQYDAQGGAGVIAINLKKDQRLGTNGSLNASYGRGEFGKFTGGGALNHRRRNLNLYGTYAYAERRNFLRLDFDRQYLAAVPLPAARSELFNDQTSLLRSHSGKLGLDYSLSKRTLLGVALTGLASQTTSRTANRTEFFDAKDEATDRYRSTTDQDVRRPSGAANVNFRHALADSANAPALSADADVARYRTTRLLALTTAFEQPARADARLDGDQRSVLDIAAVKADFSQPLPRRTRLDAGVKATRVASDNDVVFTRTANGQREVDPAISNRFRYDENVNAAYVSLRRVTAAATVQAGLRAEQTNTRARLSGGAADVERHYTQLFPSVAVQRALNARHALSFSLARRIDRPSYAQVNPLRSYLDATSYRAGNPELRAQTSYNAEVSHTFRQKFTTALSYARTDLPIVRVEQPAPDGNRLVVNRDVNLRAQGFYALTLTAPLDLTKWWTLYVNALVYYNHFQGDLAGTALDRGRLAGNLTLNNSFTLPHGWAADANAFYESREVFGFEYLRARGQVSAGLQKSLWNKQGSLRLNVTDLLYTTPLRVTSIYDNFSESFRSRQDTRVVTAAFTYRFGNGKVAAARKRAAGAEEELRRAAGQ